MTIHSRHVVAGTVRITAEAREELLIARNALEMLYGSARDAESSALLHHIDAAANAYIMLRKTLRSIGALGGLPPAVAKP